MSQSRKEWVDDANMSSRKAPVGNDILKKFVAYHWHSSYSLSLLDANPTLLDTHTIESLECKARDILLQTYPFKEHDARTTISAAALLEICIGKSQPGVQKQVKSFAGYCVKTQHEHLEHALNICDRIEQKFNYDNVDVALKEMSLKDGEAALVQTTQV
ncbi:hypothetical protein G3M48_003171 [Beauveria asiatica]|uniref:Uncharacterized protein n=1 Tax=Beauveria asiatica TaxID=1069075 RepID=A0AAW0RVP6_9HYPO